MITQRRRWDGWTKQSKGQSAQDRNVQPPPTTNYVLEVDKNGFTTFVEKTEIGENRLLPITIRERMSNIPDDELELLGYDPKTARPEWFVLQALPVPPVTVRPSIIL